MARDCDFTQIPDWDGTLDECKDSATADWSEQCTIYENDREELAVLYPDTEWTNSEFDHLFDEDDNRLYPNDGTHRWAANYDNPSSGFYSRDCIVSPANEIYLNDSWFFFSTDIYKLIDYCFEKVPWSTFVYVCGSSTRLYLGATQFHPSGGDYVVSKTHSLTTFSGTFPVYMTYFMQSLNPTSASGTPPNCSLNQPAASSSGELDIKENWTFADQVAQAQPATFYYDLDTGDYHSNYGYVPGTCI